MFRLISLTTMVLFLHSLCSPGPVCADELQERLQKFEHAFSIGPGDPRGVAQELIDWGKQRGDKQAEARGHLRLAFMDAVPGNEESGWRGSLKRGIELAGAEKSVARAEALLFHGYTQGRADYQIDSGLAGIDEAIALARELQSDRVLTISYLLAAELLRVSRRKSQARKYNFRCLAFARQAQSPGLHAIALRKVVDDLTRFRCYQDGIPYARELQSLSDGHSHLTERLLHRAGELPEYEDRLRERVLQHVASKPTGGRRVTVAKEQLDLACLIMKTAPDEALELTTEAVGVFKAAGDLRWMKVGNLMAAMIPRRDESKAETYRRFDKVLSSHKSNQILHWLSDGLNVDVAAFFEHHEQWKASADWRKQEAGRMHDWATGSTGDAVSSAQAFLENELRLRQERNQITVERDEIAVEREDFAQERRRFSQTQLALMWITGLVLAGAIGTRMFMMRRLRKQLQLEVERKTASLRSAKQDAEAARDRAERAGEAKSDFLACINHELRNPLNAILGYSQLLQQVPAGLCNRELRGIESSTEHLLQLVNNVLDVSSIEHGEIQVHERCFDLHELCAVVDNILQQSATSKSIAFYSEIAPSVPRYVVGDESKIRQLFINLCSNGIKFTNKGHVKMTLSADDPVESKFTLTALVKDTGCGLASVDVQSLFAPYSQSSRARENRAGTGLGLYICKSFTDRMSGSLTASNSPDGGAEFRLKLPLKNGHEPTHKSRTLPSGTEKAKILVVDDNRENLDVVARLLQAMGHETRIADSKAPALAEVESWEPDLVFLDIHMPGADGFDVAQAIRETEVGRRTKIVAITGDAIENVRERALSNGFDGFLPKPVRLKSIEQAIGELVRQ